VKVKQQPDDFEVEELSRLKPGVQGPFALYRLHKQGMGTLEAVVALCRAWKVPRRAVAFAGLKDRYGRTAQCVSIRSGPQRNFEGRGFRLNYLGRSLRPAVRGTVAGNRFRIVLRDLCDEQAACVAERALAAEAHGVPDYFDDQRFGSLRGTNGEFVARALLDGDAQKALRLAIASPSRADRSKMKRRRRLLQRKWGDWKALARELDGGTEQRICRRLAEGAAFEEAYALVDETLRSLHLAAFQSFLFNRMLRAAVGDGPQHLGVAGPYVFCEAERADLRELSFPLASRDAPADAALDAVLQADGLTRQTLSALPFRPGFRGALFIPRELAVGEPEPDDLNAGRRKLALHFTLRPGSYATMLIKRCTFGF